MRTVFILLVSVFCLSASSTVKFTAINRDELRHEITLLVNELRKKKNRSQLRYNDTLKKAAQHHSDYVAKRDKLTHYEGYYKYRSPKDRVKAYGGTNFGTVGENVLFTTLDYTTYDPAKIKALAKEAFDLWYKSPGHYKNMVFKDLSYADIGIAIHYPKKRIYITQVFGEK
ncbi:CAP domain-containing protein [Lishizhenia sp.]|uniref:CAP domain-containing protein n=1 Tax=Lishizhenia sp. TaxID=2497594 RepID=UPI00299D8F62|nr:CAP domain-containing protein [Lishizhenia sp.]MDX1445754.1 CAP domain-containing protein [Lishizhenia sp.]